MLISCTNKGCLKQSNALLDTETGNVICQECGKPVSNISGAMKRTLKSFGQLVRSNERKAFLLACPKCKANREIALDENNNTVCKVCYAPITVTASFKLAMETANVKLEKINTEEESNEKNE